jgi:hypothetical protein
MAGWRRDARSVPERLARFVLSEWPGSCPHDALRQWQRACLAWLADEPDRRALRFGEYGDCIDVLREVGPLRRQLPLCSPGKCPARNP